MDGHILVEALDLEQLHVTEDVEAGQQLPQTQGRAGPADDLSAKTDGIFPNGAGDRGQIPPDHGEHGPVGQQGGGHSGGQCAPDHGLIVGHLGGAGGAAAGADATVYTFCMCPGGYVVAAASEEGRVVTNGMSYADREGENANAALLVTVNPEDFPDKSTLGGMYWQRSIEEAAYRVSNSYHAPAQLVGDFLEGKASTGCRSVEPTYQPGVAWCDLNTVLPGQITRALKEALPKLDGQLKGYAHPDAVLTAPETRSSSPVRILRDESRQSEIKGLYPCGEGAGYAGGIMSAAVDGIQTAEAILAELTK